MISIRITEVKAFMAKLLTNTVFDAFLLREMELQTFTGFTVTGQFNEGFFTSEELEERGDDRLILWSEVKPIAFTMIKGSKTPLSLKIVFQLPVSQCDELINRLGGRYRLEEIGGLYLNVRYEKGELRIITGTAIKTFTLDKSLEQEWDGEVKDMLKEQAIAYDEE